VVAVLETVLMAVPLYERVPRRPDGLRSWEEHQVWYTSLPLEEFNLWLEWANDDDGNQGENCPAGTVVDGRRIGVDVPLSQDQFEWWVSRNKWHNKHFFINARPVISPIYYAGRPTETLPDGSPDYRYEVNRFYVSRTNPPFWKWGMLYSGYRADKPATPVPPWWVPRPPGSMGGAYDPAGFKTLHYP
jgi:hypothetical protein